MTELFDKTFTILDSSVYSVGVSHGHNHVIQLTLDGIPVVEVASITEEFFVPEVTIMTSNPTSGQDPHRWNVEELLGDPGAPDMLADMALKLAEEYYPS